MKTTTALRKLWRFNSIYGPGRTFSKAMGRLRIGAFWRRWRRGGSVGLIGCGQFAFATISHFLGQSREGRLLACYDINPKAAQSLAKAQGVAVVAPSAEALIAQPGLRLVYIASNHASHTPYAVQALEHGLDVVIEKPVSVDFEQLCALTVARRRLPQRRVFAGYNRPFSAAIQELHRRMPVLPEAGMTFQCLVVGHFIPADHWYKRPEEGTRICGNIGHWLDLAVHLMSWRGLPDRLDLALSWADPADPNENLTLTLISDRQDLITLTLTARAEPFEGVRECIHVQHGETLCEIEDFRRMRLWQGERLRRWRYWPKDVGHRLAVLQPFQTEMVRDWNEVELSTLLMLELMEMVRARRRQGQFSFKDAKARLDAAVEQALA